MSHESTRIISREESHERAIALLRSELTKLQELDLTHQVDKSMKHVGGGGSSDVYKGIIRSDSGHRLRGKPIAVKKVRSFLQVNLDPLTVSRFTREIKIWDHARHKNCLQLLGYTFVINELPALVTEWMKNGTVLEYLSVKPDVKIIPIALGITDGLCFLHSRNIIHADMKLANVLVSDDGSPLICDFGLSIALPGAMTVIKTLTSKDGQGTHRWMAPELFNERDPTHSKESDVWAYGMTILELITKEAPYSDLGDLQVLIEISKNKLPSLPLAFPHHEQERLRIICEQCWAIDPLKRSTMDDIAQSLTVDKIICVLESDSSTEEKLVSAERLLDIRSVGDYKSEYRRVRDALEAVECDVTSDQERFRLRFLTIKMIFYLRSNGVSFSASDDYLDKTVFKDLLIKIVMLSDKSSNFDKGEKAIATNELRKMIEENPHCFEHIFDEYPGLSDAILQSQGSDEWNIVILPFARETDIAGLLHSIYTNGNGDFDNHFGSLYNILLYCKLPIVLPDSFDLSKLLTRLSVSTESRVHVNVSSGFKCSYTDILLTYLTLMSGSLLTRQQGVSNFLKKLLEGDSLVSERPAVRDGIPPANIAQLLTRTTEINIGRQETGSLPVHFVDDGYYSAVRSSNHILITRRNEDDDKCIKNRHHSDFHEPDTEADGGIVFERYENFDGTDGVRGERQDEGYNSEHDDGANVEKAAHEFDSHDQYGINLDEQSIAIVDDGLERPALLGDSENREVNDEGDRTVGFSAEDTQSIDDDRHEVQEHGESDAALHFSENREVDGPNVTREAEDENEIDGNLEERDPESDGNGDENDIPEERDIESDGDSEIDIHSQDDASHDNSDAEDSRSYEEEDQDQSYPSEDDNEYFSNDGVSDGGSVFSYESDDN